MRCAETITIAFVVWAIAGSFPCPAAGDDFPKPVDVFASGTEDIAGVKNTAEKYPQYREQNIVVTNSGKLVVVCQGRNKSRWSDRSGQDLVVKTSTDSGKTWGKARLVATHGLKSICPNAAVYDRQMNRIHVLYNLFMWDFTNVPDNIRGEMGDLNCRQFQVTSDDEGATWSAPREISQMVQTHGAVMVVGSGEGIQLEHGDHKGRLIIAGGDFYQGKKVLCFYSDDHGTTWLRSEPVPFVGKMAWASESKIAELPDGTLVLNSRTFVVDGSGPRLRTRAFSSDGAQTWTQLENDPALKTVSCNGSLIAVPHAKGKGGTVLLCSVPVGPRRTHGTVYVSFDGGRTWPRSRLVVPDAFAYSSLMQLPDGHVGLFFESEGYAEIKLVRFSVPWLLETEDSLAVPDSTRLNCSFLPDLPDSLGIAGPYVGEHRGALIVAGGANFCDKPLIEGGEKVWHDRIFVLETGSDKWNTGFRLKQLLAYGGSTSTDRGVVLVGGSDEQLVYADATLVTWEPDTKQLRQTPLPPLPLPTAKCRAASIGEKIYVLAGKTTKDETATVKKMWMLDLNEPPSSRRWKTRTPWPGKPRANAVVATHEFDGHICLFLFSGVHTTTNDAGVIQRDFLTDAYRYDPRADTWHTIASLPVLEELRDIPGKASFAGQRWPVAAGCAIGAERRGIVLFGGTTGRYIHLENGSLTPLEDRPLNSRRVLVYDPVRDSWQEIGQMEIGVLVTQAVRWNGQLVVPSGETKPGIRTPTVQVISFPSESKH